MIIKAKVFPDSNEDLVVKKDKDSFEVWVKAKPIQGRANQAVRRALADYLHKELEDIRIIKGFRERNKVFEIK